MCPPANAVRDGDTPLHVAVKQARDNNADAVQMGMGLGRHIGLTSFRSGSLGGYGGKHHVRTAAGFVHRANRVASIKNKAGQRPRDLVNDDMSEVERILMDAALIAMAGGDASMELLHVQWEADQQRPTPKTPTKGTTAAAILTTTRREGVRMTLAK